MKTKVLSVGGSIIAPDGVDVELLSEFSRMICKWLDENKDSRLVFVAGGGAPARVYQNAYRNVAAKFDDRQKAMLSFANQEETDYACDWIGITATRLNAQILKTVFGPLCQQEVITDPTKVCNFTGRILVAAGWKPGFSTDTDAVYLAEQFNADTVVNLSNIEKVYTDDPRKNPDAKPIDSISYSALISSVSPGTMKRRREFRSIWRRNLNPSPLPSEAPSMIPGMSAITKDLWSWYETIPKDGSRVVKG